jgi:multiple sugar transport system ATP-binding protein
VASVTFESVNKSYSTKTGDVRAVQDFTLDIADTEFVVLVGPSGCGKTTTLRLLAGLEAVDRGTIRIGDRVVNDVPPKDRNVAMVFQNYALYPHMTVRQNLAFGLKMRRVRKKEIHAKVQDAADLLGIDHLLDRKPAALSGGEQQRVALGRAIVRDPHVFLFDEPLSNLDARLRVHMRTELRNLHQNLKTTVIYVTHDQEEAMTLGDRIVIMDKGVVRQSGAPLDVYHHPENRFVAGFTGAPSMNFLSGHLVAGQNAVSFVGRGDIHLTLDPQRTPPLRTEETIEAFFGVRPEHLHLLDVTPAEPSSGHPSPPTADAGRIQVTVTAVEPLGDRLRLHVVTTAGETLIAQVDPAAAVAPGQRRLLDIDVRRAHLFAATTDGRRLGRTAEAGP